MRLNIRNILPFLGLLSSAGFFFSFGFFFKVGPVTDSILLQLNIQNTIGTILQVSWFGIAPLFYEDSKGSETKTALSTAAISCFLLNLGFYFLIFLLSSWREEPLAWFSVWCAAYSIFFQLHVLFKFFYLAEGRLSHYYILDIFGYLFPIPLFFVASRIAAVNNVQIEFVFMAMTFSWLVVVLADLLINKKNVVLFFSWELFCKCLRRVFIARLASMLYSMKDILLPISLGAFGGAGTVTIYSYISRISSGLFQTLPMFKVNKWVGCIKNNSSLTSMYHVDIFSKLILRDFSLAFGGVFLLAGLVFYNYLMSYGFTAVDVLAIILSVYFCAAIQSYEQPYARLIFIKSFFNVSALSDVTNSIVFFVFYCMGIFFKSIYFPLFGSVAAQLCSCIIYRCAVRKEN